MKPWELSSLDKAGATSLSCRDKQLLVLSVFSNHAWWLIALDMSLLSAIYVLYRHTLVFKFPPKISVPIKINRPRAYSILDLMFYLCFSPGRHGKGGHHNNTKGGLKSTMKFFKHHGKMHMKSAYKAMGAPKRCVSHLNQSFKICFLKGSSILDLACVRD